MTISSYHYSAGDMSAQMQNVRDRLPPFLRSICFPDSASCLARNLLFAIAALNVLLLLTSLSTAGARFIGSSVFLASIASCCHAGAVTMVLGSHVARALESGSEGIVHGVMPHLATAELLSRLAALLRGTARRYGSNPFAYGALFGSTATMALLMHVISTYFGKLSECVSAGYAAYAGAALRDDDHVTSSFNPFAECGAAGAVGFAWFLAGCLFWLNLLLAVVLFVGRDELMIEAQTHQYDEIDANTAPGTARNTNDSFDGDFPTISAGPSRTLHI